MSGGAREAPHCLSYHHGRLLGLAIGRAGLSAETFVEGVVKRLPGRTGLDDLTQADFDLIMDGFVALGFRHPAVPILSAEQFACLDRCRRRLGLSGRAYLRIVRDTTGIRVRRLMTGEHFLALMALFERFGAGEAVPSPGVVDRREAMALRLMALRAGIAEPAFRALLAHLGGTARLADLDARAFRRIRSRLYQLGAVEPEPAPIAPAGLGMATQAQVNLLWRLWHDRGGDAAGNRGSAWLDGEITRTLGLTGGVETLTRAGARKLLDHFTGPPRRGIISMQSDQGSGRR